MREHGRSSALIYYIYVDMLLLYVILQNMYARFNDTWLGIRLPRRRIVFIGNVYEVNCKSTCIMFHCILTYKIQFVVLRTLNPFNIQHVSRRNVLLGNGFIIIA